jgi:hypothetical protein
MMKRLARLAAAATLLAAASAVSQPRPVVLGEPAIAPKAAPAARLRLASGDAITPRGLRAEAQLSPVAESEIEDLRRANQRAVGAKRLAIGVNRAADGARPLPSAGDLRWTAVEGGQAAQAAVTSPQAAALRLAIDLAGVPPNVEMVFFGSAAPDRLVGPIRVGDIADRTTAWWSPVTEGDTQTVEFFVPAGAQARTLPLRITRVSHLFAGPSTKFEKRIQDIGQSGSCNVDVTCNNAVTATLAFQNTKEAVAQMVFNDGVFTILCTGTLLNDSEPSTQAPWFYSANHCFEADDPPYRTPAQMQAVANTLNTLWHFEATSCGSMTQSSSYSQLSGGATYVYNNRGADVLFLRLNNQPPAGSFFNGWDANALSTGIGVISIHHPEGDLKKVSTGTVQGFESLDVSGGTGFFVRVGWGAAIVEPGSSGGGIFTSSGGGQYLLRGGLYAGPSFCGAATSERYDYFSRFDQVYPALAQYLGTPTALIDYTDLWWNPNESGWGLNLIQHASRNIFGVWYTYRQDGKAVWYVIPGGTWTSDTVFTATVYITSGPAQTGAFDTNRVIATPVGSVVITFTNANNGTFAYTINGISGSKSITRQPF